MPDLTEDVKYYGNVVLKLEKSTDVESEGAIQFYLNKLDEAVKNFVRQEK